jgi:hypothetical protein
MMRPDQLSGVLKITLTARTPLLIGGFSSQGPDGGEQRDVPRRADGKAMVPGSGLKGAVRSLHEALAGGCLRILNGDWVPVHRHPATTAETRDLGLAVVTAVDADGRATRVSLCDEWIWIPKELLPRSEGRLPRAGDWLQFRSHDGKTVPPPENALTGTGTRKVLLARSKEHPQGVSPDGIVRVGELGPVDAAQHRGHRNVTVQAFPCLLGITGHKAQPDSEGIETLLRSVMELPAIRCKRWINP